MEAMGILGFVFGLAGLSFGIMSHEKIETLNKDIEKLKANFKINEPKSKDE